MVKNVKMRILKNNMLKKSNIYLLKRNYGKRLKTPARITKITWQQI